MEESMQIALLEEENLRLKKENEMLFKIIAQMRNSINLLVSQYIVNTGNKR